MKGTELQKRLMTSSIVLVVTFTAIYFSDVPAFQPIFSLLYACIIGAALWEYYQIAKTKGFHPPANLVIGCTIAYAFSVYNNTQTEIVGFLPNAILGFTLIALFTYFILHNRDPFVTLAISMFGFIYLTIPLSTGINIIYYYPEGIPDGRYYFLFVIVVTKMTDTAAYFIGRRFGKNKLAPTLSPQKTWEGSIAGIAAALITGIVMTCIANYYISNSDFITLSQAITLSFLISILAQFGDLAESMLKRDGGVKDSNQIPGLGGILDMVDSLVFTLPLMYIFMNMQSF